MVVVFATSAGKARRAGQRPEERRRRRAAARCCRSLRRSSRARVRGIHGRRRIRVRARTAARRARRRIERAAVHVLNHRARRAVFVERRAELAAIGQNEIAGLADERFDPGSGKHRPGDRIVRHLERGRRAVAGRCGNGRLSVRQVGDEAQQAAAFYRAASGRDHLEHVRDVAAAGHHFERGGGRTVRQHHFEQHVAARHP